MTQPRKEQDSTLGHLGTKQVSRRDFLKTTALLGGSALFASQLGWTRGFLERLNTHGPDTAGWVYDVQQPENTIYSVCLQCHVSCPIKAKLQNGILYKLDGNPYSALQLLPQLPFATLPFTAARTDGKICSKAQAGIQTLYDPYRVVKVLKRAGPRGSGKWRTISFDRAVQEIVEGGNLFGEGQIEGLRSILALRDPTVAKDMAGDIGKIKAGQMSVAQFKAKHAAHLDVLIDPDHPDKGPKNNQFIFQAGRIEHGRKEFAQRFTHGAFGSVNFFDHFNICEESHHIEDRFREIAPCF